jgi:hypothetical protein
MMATDVEKDRMVSNLASVLESGQFAVAAEFSPPRGVNLEAITKGAQVLDATR